MGVVVSESVVWFALQVASIIPLMAKCLETTFYSTYLPLGSPFVSPFPQQNHISSLSHVGNLEFLPQENQFSSASPTQKSNKKYFKMFGKTNLGFLFKFCCFGLTTVDPLQHSLCIVSAHSEDENILSL